MAEHKGSGTTPAAEHDRFIKAILAEPDNATLRLIYADWLEERGDPRGEFLRLEAALMKLPREDTCWAGMTARLRELRGTIDRDWLVALGRERIELCDLSFEFQCPKQWNKLRLTEDPTVRFCDACRQNVYHCGTLDLARRHAMLGHCVAVDPAVPRKEGDLVSSGRMEVVGLLPLSDVRRQWRQPPPPTSGRRRRRRRGGDQ
jgi:uncharacterized protein (TIGR02996 family)